MVELAGVGGTQGEGGMEAGELGGAGVEGEGGFGVIGRAQAGAEGEQGGYFRGDLGRRVTFAEAGRVGREVEVVGEDLLQGEFESADLLVGVDEFVECFEQTGEFVGGELAERGRGKQKEGKACAGRQCAEAGFERGEGGGDGGDVGT